MEEYDSARTKIEKIENLIEERIGYIIRFISNEMKYEFKSWSFNQDDYYHEKTMKDFFFEKEYDISNFGFDPVMGTDGQYCFYASFDDKIQYRIDWNNLNRSFPKRWIFEDFEEEFKAGRERFLKEFEPKQEKRNEIKLLKLKKEQDKIKKRLNKLQEEEIELTSRFVKAGPHQFASENK